MIPLGSTGQAVEARIWFGESATASFRYENRYQVLDRIFPVSVKNPPDNSFLRVYAAIL